MTKVTDTKYVACTILSEDLDVLIKGFLAVRGLIVPDDKIAKEIRIERSDFGSATVSVIFE